MLKTKELFARRQKRTRFQVKTRGKGRARLTVFRSGEHIYAQVIDDLAGKTLAAASSLDKELTLAEQTADGVKAKVRLALVRREFDYLRNLARVVHLHHAFQVQPDRPSRDRLLDAIDTRNAQIDGFFDPKPKSTTAPACDWAYVFFPPIGHTARHLRLSYDGYQEPYSRTPLNWNTKTMRDAPLPGEKPAPGNAGKEPALFDKPPPPPVDDLDDPKPRK